jgi:SpoVK/Ycf46/Vps4 family AAA+-type ATPase
MYNDEIKVWSLADSDSYNSIVESTHPPGSLYQLSIACRGTGKTLLAKAVAKIIRCRGRGSSSSIGGAFISLSSSEIVRAEVGTSEKMVLSAFQTARANAPSVIFIDEFQALFTERTSGGSGRLSTTLLQCMDDIKQWRDLDCRGNASDDDDASNEGRVLVLAATNTPWMVDHAFLRPGRFDRAVHVGLPDADERKSILRIHVGRMRRQFGSSTAKLLTLCDVIAQRTEGFSGADLAALCRASAIRCLVEQSDFVDDRHFFESLDDGLKASSTISLVNKIRVWRP